VTSKAESASGPGKEVAVPARPVEIEHLTKYYGETRGVEDISLTVEEGDVFGFIGPNGAGKTTTIRCLLDMIFPTRGSARIFGLDSRKGSREIKRLVGYLPSEDFAYKSMTARDLLAYSARLNGLDPSASRARMEELADVLALDLGRKIKELSRGNRRKVSLIKCVLPEPRLLILDEPTSGLDPLMQLRVFELLQQQRERGTTVFFSSHILSEVQKICSRVAIIREGAILRTESIGTLQKEHLKKVSLVLRTGVSLHAIDLPGVSELTRDGNTVRFLYSGAAGDLLDYLVTRGIHRGLEDFLIETSTLEEIFIDYYERGDGEDDR
jgi:ABC-2 type transport system ATP-binding protein